MRTGGVGVKRLVKPMAGTMRTRIARGERGTALVEAAIIVPLVLLIMVGIFEVGRLYQTYQVLTNAAREGARASTLPSGSVATSQAIVTKYMQDGQLPQANTASVNVDRTAQMVVNGQTMTASLVTVDYPFQFMMLQPVANLVVSGSTAGQAFTMRTTALMRNEAP
jgi:Flp pilus assembly protein TadG